MWLISILVTRIYGTAVPVDGVTKWGECFVKLFRYGPDCASPRPRPNIYRFTTVVSVQGETNLARPRAPCPQKQILLILNPERNSVLEQSLLAPIQLVALFEAEKTRLKTASFQQIKGSRNRFCSVPPVLRAAHRRASEAATRNANIALARSLADGSLAREQMLDVQQQIARIQIEFDQLNASLKEAWFFMGFAVSQVGASWIGE